MRELPDQPGMCSLDLALQFASYASLGIIFNSVAFQFPYQQIALSVLVCLLGYCEPKYVALWKPARKHIKVKYDN